MADTYLQYGRYILTVWQVHTYSMAGTYLQYGRYILTVWQDLTKAFLL